MIEELEELIKQQSTEKALLLLKALKKKIARQEKAIERAKALRKIFL